MVQNAYYRRKVLNTFFFGMQSVLQLNQVIFPYGKDEHGDPQLAGLILEDFSDLHERIEFGKRLYALLFGVPGVAKGVLAFVKASRHTGSRSDYAPELFAPVRRLPPAAIYEERLSGGGCGRERSRCTARRFMPPGRSAPLIPRSRGIGSPERHRCSGTFGASRLTRSR